MEIKALNVFEKKKMNKRKAFKFLFDLGSGEVVN